MCHVENFQVLAAQLSSAGKYRSEVHLRRAQSEVLRKQADLMDEATLARNSVKVRLSDQPEQD